MPPSIRERTRQRLSSRLQLRLMQHSPTGWEVLRQAMERADGSTRTREGWRASLGDRATLLGPNFAAGGRLVIGEHAMAAALLGERGEEVIFAALPQEQTGRRGTGTPSPVLEAVVVRGVHEARVALRRGARAELHAALDRLAVRYVLQALVGVSLDDAQVEDARALLLVGEPSARLDSASDVWMSSRDAEARRRRLGRLCRVLETTPTLHERAGAVADRPFDPGEVAGALVRCLSEAAMPAAAVLARAVVDEIPARVGIAVEDPREVRLAVLEAARLSCPVGSVFSHLAQRATLHFAGGPRTLPAGTKVEIALSLANLDPLVFPDPWCFSHRRENLAADLLGFHDPVRGDLHLPSRPPSPWRPATWWPTVLGMGDHLLVAWRTTPPGECS